MDAAVGSVALCVAGFLVASSAVYATVLTVAAAAEIGAGLRRVKRTVGVDAALVADNRLALAVGLVATPRLLSYRTGLRLA